MATRSSIFPSRDARQTFLVLIIGFIVLVTAGIFIYSGILPNIRAHFAKQVRTNQVMSLVGVARRVPPQALERIVRAHNNRELRVRLEERAFHGYKKIMQPTHATIFQEIKTRPYLAKFTVPLNDGRWLTFETRVPGVHLWLLFGLLLMAVIVIFALVMLSFWAVKRLALPLGDFAQEAKRWSVDVSAPPLAETGSKEMRELINSLNQMQARIKKLLGDRTQMLAAISHDLRTPITRLKLRAEYIEDTKHYQKILQDLDEMELMINSVLAFAREDSQQEMLQRFDLEALLDSLCEDLASAGKKVEYIGYGARLPVSGRISTLKRGLTNLIENAIKYGDTAHVELKKRAAQVVITVDDNGPGIPESEFKRVFEPFYRIEQSRSRETGGTGLGLVIARDAIRAHGGDIVLINRAEGGLRVTVTLPLQE